MLPSPNAASAKRILSRNRDLFCLVALGLVSGLFLWPAWQQPDGLWYAPGAVFSDLTVTHWPNMWFVAQAVHQHGEVPLWRPQIMGGGPFVGNPLAALFYPANWLFLLLPVSWTFHLQFALHIFGAGAALYGLARWGYGHSPIAALIAGLGYALTPKLIAHMGAGHVGLSQAYAWLPLTLWLLRGAVERRSAHRAVGCGATLAVAYLADPRVAFYAAALLLLYALYRLVEAWRRSGWRAARTLALARRLVAPLLASSTETTRPFWTISSLPSGHTLWAMASTSSVPPAVGRSMVSPMRLPSTRMSMSGPVVLKVTATAIDGADFKVKYRQALV